MATENTTSQDLFSHLFEACNILRGPINQDEYKSYVTPILFFKRLSDVYDEETQRALDESDGDEEYAAFPENHSFVIPEGCHWKDVREVSENVGTAIVNAMYRIERANPDRLSGVFSSFDDANWTDKTTMTRDVHAFMVQSNTSDYGDSRISGPYSRDQRNLVQIKGGDNDSLIVGTINISEIRYNRKTKRQELEDEVSEILNMDKTDKLKYKDQLIGDHKLKISKVSARTKF